MTHIFMMIRTIIIFFCFLLFDSVGAITVCPVGTYCPYGFGKANTHLLGYWQFTPGSGILQDVAGSVGPLTAVGTLTPKIHCQWAYANGISITDTSYLQLPSVNLGALSAAQGFSVCIWFSFSITYTAFSRIFEFKSGTDKVIVSLYSGSTTLSFEVWSGGNVNIFVSSDFKVPFAIDTINWFHLCLCNQGLTWQVYINGVLVKTEIFAFTLQQTPMTTNFIGHSSDVAVEASYMSVDEFRLYGVMLSQDQVSSIYSFKALPCPVGSFQNTTNQMTCMWCADEPNALYQPQQGMTKCQNRVLPSMYSPQAATLATSDNNLVAYYPFSSYSPTTDMSGVMGNLVMQGSVSFTSSNIPWGYAPSAYFTGGDGCLSLGTSSINPLSSVFTMGLTIGFWFMIGSGYSNSNTGLFFLGNAGYPYVMARFNAVGANGIYYQWRMSATNFNERTVGTVTLDVWMHVVFVIQYPTWKTYVNGALIDTFTLTHFLAGNLESGILTVGSNTDTCTNKLLQGGISEFRIYNRGLSLSEIADIYSFRVYYCHAGTSNSLMNQQTCNQCPVNTYQNTDRETSCINCANSYNTQTGSISCPSALSCTAQRSDISGMAEMAGQVQIINADYSIAFGCPAGTFYPAINTLTQLTEGCSFSSNGVGCTVNSCCIWMSSQYSSYTDASKAFNLNTFELAQTMNYQAREYIAIDLLNSQYVSHVLLSDRTSLNCERGDYVMIYVGNTLVAGDNKVTPVAGTNMNKWYPENDYQNTPCAVVPAGTTSYRRPIALACKTWGRYVYVVHYSTVDYLNYVNVVVLGQPPCSECQPGSYSNGIKTNVNCAKCPAGTFQSGVGMSFCQNCPAGTFQMLAGQAYCNVRVPPGSYAVSGSDANNFLMAYYTFFTYARLVDSTGVLGNPTTPLAPTPTYISDGAWTGSEALDLSSAVNGAYLSLPALNLGTMNTGTGFSICLWYSFVSVPTATNNTLFEFALPSVFSLAVNYSIATSKLNLIVQNAANTVTVPFSTTLTTSIWQHVCVTGQAFSGVLYENGVSTGTFSLSNLPNLLLTSVTFAAGRYGLYKTRVYLDELRIYSKALTAADIATLYLYRVRSCAKGTYQDKFDQVSCKSCGPGYAQTSAGQQACTACAYATWYGTSNCASNGLLMSDALAVASTPGTARLTYTTNNLYFNCPSGTFSTGLSLLTPLTANCQTSYVSLGGAGTACTTGQCCIWATASMGMPNNSPIDALTSPVFTSIGTGNFIGVDLVTAKYIDTILFFDARDVGPEYTNGFYVFVGNVSYKSSGGQVSVNVGDIPSYTYPSLVTQENVLCYQDDGTMSGYRNPVTIRCRITGRYIYLVAGSGGRISMSEIAVLDTPACTLCPPGTFSLNTQPNTKCSPCPVGQFQSMASMSYCSKCSPGSFQDTQGGATCKYCSQGMYQSEYGRTYCVLEASIGYYTPPSHKDLINGLIAHYTFDSTQRLQDASGVTGPLTAYRGAISYASDCQWSGAECLVLNKTMGYMAMPQLSLSTYTDMSICMWYRYDGASSYGTLFSLDDGTLNTWVALRQDGVNGFNLILEMQYDIYNPIVFFSNGCVTGVWKHVCVVVSGSTWNTYINLVPQDPIIANGLSISSLARAYIGLWNNGPNYPFYGKIDEFRIYTKALTVAQIQMLYEWRPSLPCPVGSFQDTTAVASCKPCPIGTFQNETGKTTCKSCLNGYNTWYGASICATAQIQVTPAVGTSLSTTPGVYSLYFPNYLQYLSFNVPSGYYSDVASAYQASITDTCSVSTRTKKCAAIAPCCVFASSESVSLWNAVDGTLTTSYSAIASEMNQYICVNFKSTTQYIHSVLIFDSATSDMVANNGLAIYIGNTLYGSGDTPPTGSPAFTYPVASQANTLCATLSAQDVGYRYPKMVSCKMTGQYLYIVMASSTLGLTIPEFVVLTSPPGTPCPAGTFSTNFSPTVSCTLCPTGTYATGTGMTSASDCVNCPLGQYATGMGGSSASVCVTC